MSNPDGESNLNSDSRETSEGAMGSSADCPIYEGSKHFPINLMDDDDDEEKLAEDKREQHGSEKGNCAICLDSTSTHGFACHGFFHACVCGACCGRLKQCPICRKGRKALKIVYGSEKAKCAICFESKITHGFACHGIFHACACKACCGRLKQCPICRKRGMALEIVYS
jgi:hypothetical protein